MKPAVLQKFDNSITYINSFYNQNKAFISRFNYKVFRKSIKKVLKIRKNIDLKIVFPV